MFTYSLTGLTLQVPLAEPEELEENETTARSAVYKLLGALFAPPQERLFEALREGSFAAEFEQAVALLPFRFVVGRAPLPDAGDVHGYAGQYAELFSGEDGSSLLRAGLRDGEVKLRREYEYFGLSTGGTDGAGGRPADHLATECEFMQYLTFREAATQADRLRLTYRTAQRDFLEHRMVPWVPGMVAAAMRQSPPEPFAWGLEALVELLRADCRYVAGLLAA